MGFILYNYYGDYMIRRLRGVVIPIALAVFLGFLCGRLMFDIYEEDGNYRLSSYEIYLLEDNTYSNYEDMRANTISSNYIYYEDDNMYNVVVGMTLNYDNIGKIKGVYDKNLSVSKYLINDKELVDNLSFYDDKLYKSNDEEEIRGIIIDMINTYRGKDDVKMVKIS